MKILSYIYASDSMKKHFARFFQENHKDYYTNFYAEDNTGFNLNIFPVSDLDNTVICYVRYMMFESRDKKIIPGNNNSRTFSKSPCFMWNNWSRQFVQKADKGCVFLATCDKNGFNITSDLTMFDHNAIDGRFIKANDQIYLCGTDLHVTYLVNIKDNKISLELTDLFMTHDVQGKNFAFVQYHEANSKLNKSCEYLNWFDYKEKCVTNFFINEDQILKDKFLRLNGDIPNYDSEHPAFSFGSPLTDLDKFKIGVGHIKITRQREYKNENIEKFRQMINTQFPLKFGNQYIEHDGSMVLGDYWGYIYMAYFYLLVKRGNNWVMYFSDAFLPLNYDKEHMDKYKFSLVFPTGIVVKDNLIYVSSGEGDYYNTVMTFDKQEVIKACRHDVSSLDLKKYEYKLLIHQENNTIEKKQLIDPTEVDYASVLNIIKSNGLKGSLYLTEKVFGSIISHLTDSELYIVTDMINKSLPKLVNDTKSILTKHSITDPMAQTNFLKELKTGDSNIIVKSSIRLLCNNRKLKEPLKKSLTEILFQILSFKKATVMQLLDLLYVDVRVQKELIDMHNTRYGFL